MENPNSKANPIPTRLEPRSRRKPRPHPVLQEEILAHAGTAVAVLRRAMLDPKPFPISRIRAAGSLLDLALQIAQESAGTHISTNWRGSIRRKPRSNDSQTKNCGFSRNLLCTRPGEISLAQPRPPSPGNMRPSCRKSVRTSSSASARGMENGAKPLNGAAFAGCRGAGRHGTDYQNRYQWSLSMPSMPDLEYLVRAPDAKSHTTSKDQPPIGKEA